MKSFKYTAVDSEGHPRSGVISALSANQAIDLLRDKSLIVTGISEQRHFNLNEYFNSLKGISPVDRIIFTRQLAVMLDAGIPIVKSLRTLQEQIRDPLLSEIVKEVAEEVDGGSSLYKAMSKHPLAFNKLYLSLVNAGERSGNLVEVLTRLSENMQRDHDFKGKIKGAMIYPLVIVVVMLAVVLIMVLFVIPRLKGLYEELGATLPITTRMILKMSDLFVNFWWLVLLVCVSGFWVLKRYAKTDRGRLVMARMQLRIPIFGLLAKHTQLASFTRTLGMLITSGLPILQSLEIANQTMENEILHQGMVDAMKAVERGESFGEIISGNRQFPSIFSEMVRVGESTGKLDNVLKNISEYFENEATRTVENLSSLLEPIVIVMLGVGVGFLIISLILPIYSLTSQF